MTRFAPLALCAALSACAHSADRLPVCDGQHRRPANPNGSVLAPADLAASQPAPAASFAPCGARP